MEHFSAVVGWVVWFGVWGFGSGKMGNPKAFRVFVVLRVPYGLPMWNPRMYGSYDRHKLGARRRRTVEEGEEEEEEEEEEASLEDRVKELASLGEWGVLEYTHGGYVGTIRFGGKRGCVDWWQVTDYLRSCEKVLAYASYTYSDDFVDKDELRVIVSGWKGREGDESGSGKVVAKYGWEDRETGEERWMAGSSGAYPSEHAFWEESGGGGGGGGVLEEMEDGEVLRWRGLPVVWRKGEEDGWLVGWQLGGWRNVVNASYVIPVCILLSKLAQVGQVGRGSARLEDWPVEPPKIGGGAGGGKGSLRELCRTAVVWALGKHSVETVGRLPEDVRLMLREEVVGVVGMMLSLLGEEMVFPIHTLGVLIAAGREDALEFDLAAFSWLFPYVSQSSLLYVFFFHVLMATTTTGRLTRLSLAYADWASAGLDVTTRTVEDEDVDVFDLGAQDHTLVDEECDGEEWWQVDWVLERVMAAPELNLGGLGLVELDMTGATGVDPNVMVAFVSALGSGGTLSRLRLRGCTQLSRGDLLACVEGCGLEGLQVLDVSDNVMGVDAVWVESLLGGDSRLPMLRVFEASGCPFLPVWIMDRLLELYGEKDGFEVDLVGTPARIGAGRSGCGWTRVWMDDRMGVGEVRELFPSAVDLKWCLTPVVYEGGEGVGGGQVEVLDVLEVDWTSGGGGDDDDDDEDWVGSWWLKDTMLLGGGVEGGWLGSRLRCLRVGVGLVVDDDALAMLGSSAPLLEEVVVQDGRGLTLGGVKGWIESSAGAALVSVVMHGLTLLDPDEPGEMVAELDDAYDGLGLSLQDLVVSLVLRAPGQGLGGIDVLLDGLEVEDPVRFRALFTITT